MNDTLAEFQKLIRQYHDASEALAKASLVHDVSDIGAFAKAILQQRDRLAGIDQLSGRIIRFCDSIRSNEIQLDSQSRKQALAAMAAAKEEAAKLNELCENCAKMLETSKNKRGKQLGDIGKRRQYLKAMKPVKGNYPKFIDSLC